MLSIKTSIAVKRNGLQIGEKNLMQWFNESTYVQKKMSEKNAVSLSETWEYYNENKNNLTKVINLFMVGIAKWRNQCVQMGKQNPEIKRAKSWNPEKAFTPSSRMFFKGPIRNHFGLDFHYNRNKNH